MEEIVKKSDYGGERDVCDVDWGGAHALEVVGEEAENNKLLEQEKCDCGGERDMCDVDWGAYALRDVGEKIENNKLLEQEECD
jgi:hypothetical protein